MAFPATMTDCQVSAHRPPPQVAYITVKEQTPFQAAAVTGDEGYSRRWHTPRQPCSTAYSQAGPKAPMLTDPNFQIENKTHFVM